MKNGILALIIAAVALNAAADGPQKGDKVDLRILETSDVHGCFFPWNFIKNERGPGALGRVSYYVDSLRKSHPDRVILLENGDLMQGQPICYYSNLVDTLNQNIAAQVVNYMKYDAQNFGNHDVETKHAVYDKWVNEVKCPVLGANIIDTSTGMPYAVPYTIINRGGVKVAVLGMISPAIPNWLSPDHWSGMRFVDMVESARYWVKFIKTHEKPDLLVGMFHSGYEGGIVTDSYRENASAQVAREVPGFDIIFFGHDHQRHNSMDDVNGGGKVLVLNPSNNAMAVAEAQVTMEWDGERWCVAERKGNLVDVRNTPVHQAYHEHFYPYVRKVKEWVSEPIGNLPKDINSQDCFFGNSEFNDMILDMMLKITEADIAFCAPLSPTAQLKKGEITRGHMFELYRFENLLYVMELSGKEIRGALEMSYDRWVSTMKSASDHLIKMKQTKEGKWTFENASYNFDSAMGIDYEVDVTKPDGEKVRIVRMSNGDPWDENKIYKVAVNSYRGNGGGELLTTGAGIAHSELGKRIVYKSELDLRHYLMEEIKRQGTLHPKKGNNWKFVPEKWAVPAAKRDRELLFKK